ncbi:alpha-2-macroglobulin family protein [Spirosoma sp.]|uniref:alpha-2-macroglobulin family protein n=1 Tax=Spirosoma sp. TaxID=1899569 RepID=UPI003B3A882C
MHSLLTVFFVLFTLAASAQNKPQPDYARDWKRADSVAAKGLPKSALDIANRIYTEAKAQKNYPQLAKAAIARTIYRTASDEDAYKEVIRSLQTDITVTPEPAKAVLQSVLGDVYWQYFQQNRHKLYNRATVNAEATKSAYVATDFTTWDARQLIDAITNSYLTSLKPKELLQKTPIGAYDVLLEKGDPETRPLRPTLYDLLAHRAIGFFQNTETDLLKPVFRFELDQPAYLAEPEVFTKLAIQSRDSLSGRYQALLLYQQVLAFHLTNPDALTDADVLRLAFVHRYSVLPERDTLYRKTLEKQIVRYKNQPAEAVYAYQLAEFLTNYNGPVQPLDDENEPASEKTNPKKWNHKQAADICRDLVKRFPKTMAGQQAAQLLNRLLSPMLLLQVEQVNMPQQPFRALVSYQNINKVLYRIIRLSTAEWQTYRDSYGITENQKRKRFSDWLKHAYVAENTVTLPDDGDLNRHSVEIPLNGLPIGQYLMLATTDSKFQEKSETAQYTLFTASTLSYLIPPVSVVGEDQTVVVANRQTGEPLRNASVSLVSTADLSWLKKYKPLKTDTNGQAKVPTEDLPRQTGFQYLITAGNDTLLSDQQYYYKDNGPNAERTQTYSKLFTDRAIYRPGQSIYVKGLVYNGKSNLFNVVSNQTITIDFLDQNGERIANQNLKTNEFGTFNASFTAPVGRLTGMMNLQTPYGSTSVRVEEYKRPTFEVKAKPIKQSYKLGQTVTLAAEAKTFSGAVVDGAEVRYRVVRKLRPRWDWWYVPRNTNQAEIANGIAKTDTKGNVSITFVATPDREPSRGSNPIFDFDVTIDVTDKAGETRSMTQTLRVGYSALQATLSIPAEIENDKPATFPVRITNQAGEKVSARGQLTVYRLQPPAQPLRYRLWERPDRQLLTKEEFRKLFPNDVFGNETDPRSWPKGEQVQQQSFVFPADSLIKPDLSKYNPGEYVAELTVTDSTGDTTRERVFFAVVNDKQPTASSRQQGWVQARKTTAEPGEEAIFWVGNSLPGWVLMTVEQNRKIVREEWLKTDGKPRRVTLPVSEQQRGGFAVHFAMIQNGRVYQISQTVTVPMTNKQLTIETQTFRNKLKPGEREEWTLTVKGLDKTPAEMVATLYDASLDMFDKLDWPTSIYLPYSPIFYGWRYGSFGIQAGNVLFYNYKPEPAIPARRYDQLAAGRGVVIRIRGRREAYGAVAQTSMAKQEMAASPMLDASGGLNDVVTVGYGERNEAGDEKKSAPNQSPVINPRRNFNETAFFLPDLKTDEQGRVILKFTMPEALTRWRLITFAHTKDLKTGTLEREVITQKELMITANAPRFLREGDTIRVTARVNNLSEKNLPITASLTLLNALTGEPINQKLNLTALQTSVNVAAGEGQAVGWALVVPAGLETVTCRLTAQSGAFTDGEEFTIPVLPNRMLVTDSQPFWVNGKERKEFNLKPLTNLNPELPVQHERLTVEVTSNPSWYALQSLPYLMDYQYECAEQLFSRLYANSLTAHIVNSRPAFKQVITEWQKNQSKSPLESNEELKAVALENSPWLADARSETERQARLGQLLDANRMEREQLLAFEKLQQLQTDGSSPASGGFRWFGGMEPNLPITLHILSGFGHLQKLGVRFSSDLQGKLADMQANAIRYVDAEMKRWVEEQKKLEGQQKKTSKGISPWYFTATQYLYARSFYIEKPVDKAVLTYLKQRVSEDWLKQSLQGQALAALALNRFGDTKSANGILASLRERARKSEELGMYWPDNQSGLYWYQTPIETQAYLIEAFDEINPVRAEVDDMKRWLLRQKQTQAWSSTKATTEAVYALLLRGSDWLGTGVNTQVSLGGQSIESRVTKTDAITGYEKVTYAASEIKPEMGVIQVAKTTDGPAWGALYWQHFEPLDRVMPGSAGLSVQKSLYVQRDSPGGPTITAITSKTSLKPGDLIKVRLVLKTDRAMEYVHLKDSRASGFEPVAALSGYKYQNGVGYYESPRDASTDFFMSYLPVGTHVFEYDLRVAQTGDFSAGVATVQCFYAPEFSAHSAGERVKVK